MAGNRVVVVPLRAGSDGDATHYPRSTGCSIVDPPTIYLEKLGKAWMEDRHEARPGVNYILERLPAGYTLYQKPRGSDPTHVDKWLYGHPSHKYFDSPNRFYPHFKHLMENGGDTFGCPCFVCSGMSRDSLRSRPSSSGIINPQPARPRPRGRPKLAEQFDSRNIRLQRAPLKTKLPTSQYKERPKTISPGMDTSRVDEEGTPDVYRNLIDKLRRQGTLDETITEPMSLDWRTEQEIIPPLLEKLRREPQFIPRTGDIVLFVRELPDSVKICRQVATGHYRLYNRATKTFLGVPAWEAGLVGQPPAEATDIDDVVEETGKAMSVIWSGVRVEPLPNPNNKNKSLSMRYKYVPLHHIRPFVFWRELLGNVPNHQHHSTIENALTMMSTLSLMGKYRFRGTWPNAFIYCHGIFIGSEMITVGDTVRLLPQAEAAEPTCTDVLVIKSIRLKLSNLDHASTNDYDEGHPYNSTVFIYGSAYTTNASRSHMTWPRPKNIKSMQDYESLFPLHPPDKEMVVPFSRIVGRVYEAETMQLWLASENANLDNGREGILQARAFAQKNDARIVDVFGATWFWADSRSEALDLRTINGLEVSKFDNMRDSKEFRKHIKVLEGLSGQQGQCSQVRGAKPDLRRFEFKADPGASIPHHNTARGGATRGNMMTDTLSFTGCNRKKRVSLSEEEEEDDDDDDDEIRHSTKIVEATPMANKKAKVMVVID